MGKFKILSHNNPGVKWYVWYNSPADALEGDVFVDEEGSDGEEDEEFYPDDCQWEQEEEPVKPGPTAVITEKVALMIHLHKTFSSLLCKFCVLFQWNLLTCSLCLIRWINRQAWTVSRILLRSFGPRSGDMMSISKTLLYEETPSSGPRHFPLDLRASISAG